MAISLPLDKQKSVHFLFFFFAEKPIWKLAEETFLQPQGNNWVSIQKPTEIYFFCKTSALISRIRK